MDFKKNFLFCITFIVTVIVSSCTQKKPHDVSSAQISGQNEVSAFFEAEKPQTDPIQEQDKDSDSKKNKKQTKQKQPEFDIPVVMNDKVEKWMDYFQGRGRKSYARWLSRSGKYIPMMKKILAENGLPLDLVYLSMIESGYHPSAYSHAHASGLWQFISGTGRRYGLKSNWWIDERRDAEKSSLAAAQYLKDLYNMFDHWYLAAAGYNAGEFKILRAIKRYDTNDFWEMSRFRYLKPETKNYVPKMIAAAIIAKEPEKYGFTDIEYQEPLQYSKVIIQKPTELSVIAKYLNIPTSTLHDLNPELLRGVTPPKYPNYELKIPMGMELAFEEALPKINKHTVDLVTKHRVRSGEALSTIARKYRVPYRSIMRINNMNSTRIRAGQLLVIPQKRGSVYSGSQTSAKKSSSVTSNAQRQVPASGQYKVKSGDSLWSISRKFSVSVSQLRQWNDIQNSRTVQIGQNIYVQSPGVVSGQKQTAQNDSNGGQWIYYQVKQGDSLWSIAREHGTNVNDVLEWNDLNQNNITLYPGNTIKIKPIKS
ncbi:MAG TPA: LysM peptidoglycan-binding domain-containing protein [Oligoflexia bacterium]|nr:LysM peptidoglycan-binding domain-containing protein [Oligoflexia bacterium]HMR24425.1 LysM peptidoglycan-binding domain-containing protein [Oligoflexia bacterium]